MTEPGLEYGLRGTRTGYARAIHTLVGRWIAEGGGRAYNAVRNPTPKRLVINLASGWEPAYDCVPRMHPPPLPDVPESRDPVPGPAAGKGTGKASQPEILDVQGTLQAPPGCSRADLPEGAQDVYVAILEARCAGAIVIAAAGNNPGYADATGPMVPASWQQFPAPDTETCARLGVRGLAGDMREPLVYAVGGVDGNDWPIASTRVGSRPPLVAPASLLDGYPDSLRDGYGAAGCSTPPCAPTSPITGTSVAATITSSAAALVWSAHPEMSSGAVMKAVYAGATEIGMSTEICLDAPCAQKVRRVALAGAVSCSASTASACVPLPECPPAGMLAPNVAACAPKANPRGPAPDLSKLLLRSDRALPPASDAGLVTGQPIIPCPDCLVKLLEATNSYPSTLIGSIDAEFFTATGETQIDSLSLSVLDVDRHSLEVRLDTALNPAAWDTAHRNVLGGLEITGEASSAWATWRSGNHVYSQEVPLN